MTLAREIPCTVRVRYAETDAQGVAYHAHYIVWFEVARGEYLRTLGVDYNALEAGGAFAVVAEVHARYQAPVRYDDLLTVIARVDELKRSSFRFGYRVLRGDTQVAEGWSAHVMVNREGRPIRIPDSLRQALESPLAPGFRGDALPPTQA